jgi:hypothetical protein
MLMMLIYSVEPYNKGGGTFVAASKETVLKVKAEMKN